MIKKNYTIKDFLKTNNAYNASFNYAHTKIVYIANIKETPQIYITNIDGSHTKQLTHYKDFISFVSYSPTEEKIFFEKSIGGNERNALYTMDLTSLSVEKISNTDSNYSYTALSRDGKYVGYSSNERNLKDIDIYIYDLEKKKHSLIFKEGDWCSTSPFSPNNEFIAILQNRSNVFNKLYLYNIHKKQFIEISPKDEEALFYNINWVPDSSGFYLLSNYKADKRSVFFYDIKRSKFTNVFKSKWEIDSISLTMDGQYLAITINEAGYSRLYIYNNKFKLIDSSGIPEGIISSFSWSSDSKKLLFSMGSSIGNFNLYSWDKDTNITKQITSYSLNVPEKILIKERLIEYKSFDNLKIPAFVYKDTHKHKKPVIIYIHGGPESQFTPSYNSIVEYLAYKGFCVIAPNIRGSDGYGKKYLALDDVGKRFDSIKDIAYLQKYIRKSPDLDEKKIILMGASYGGYMVLAGLAFYPELWAGGVDIVGISNLVTFLKNTSSYRRKLRESEYGSLKKDRKILEKLSPSNKVDKIIAPLLIIHGKNDPRVPLLEAKQIYKSLKNRKQKVELLVYKDEGHGIVKLKNRIDSYTKVETFIDSILKNYS
ncbi:MAG: S9 family peptidase [Patescibacteria group bacterium]